MGGVLMDIVRMLLSVPLCMYVCNEPGVQPDSQSDAVANENGKPP